jgi:hypothetical protein
MPIPPEPGDYTLGGPKSMYSEVAEGPLMAEGVEKVQTLKILETMIQDPGQR